MIVRKAVTGLTLAGLLVAGCGGTEEEATESAAPARSSVFATTTVLADLIRMATCGDIEASPLVPAGTDAHDYEPDARTADELRSADLVITVGYGYESAFEGPLERAREGGSTVVELAPELRPIEAGAHAHDHHGGEKDEHGDGDEHGHKDEHGDADEHGHKDEHGAGDEHGHKDEHGAGDEHGHKEAEAHGDGMDPHVWMDPARMAEAVPVVATAIGEAGGLGVDADRLEQCAADAVAELEALDAELEAELSAVPTERRVLVTNHDSLGYFADRYDFEVLGTVIPSTSTLAEANLRDLDDLAATIKEENVPAIFGETSGANRVAEELASRVGGEVQVVELLTESLDPDEGAGTYPDMMRENSARIVEALAG